VLQTFLDLKERGLEVIVIADCISSRKQFDKEIALQRIVQEGGYVGTSESILLELCKEAGTDTFRAISKLIK
jgi:nicotinamidase-related amidase